MNDQEKLELEEYITNRFVKQENVNDDESFLISWREWLKNYDAPEILNTKICPKRPVNFANPENITIEIYPSPAGNLPLIIFGDASDFENFIVNLFHKGIRPDNISQMGASFVYGKTQRFLVLSKKYYSNTPPEVVGLSPEEWREKSLILRREHECTHYYTKKFYGSASNNLHDELIADFIGVYYAFSCYNHVYFDYFMGIDGTHEGRLTLYTENLSDNVKKEIAELARRCSLSLEEWSKTERFTNMSKAERINYLCEAGIKTISKGRI
ncbi:MAG: hypothetical protein IJU48_05625 [Synergistaceae bacterium]|nr:hypothetical protein [Synergistaceae bacterium]